VTQGRASGTGHTLWPVGVLRTSAAAVFIGLLSFAARGIAARPWISCCTGEAGAASRSRRASDVYHQCPLGDAASACSALGSSMRFLRPATDRRGVVGHQKGSDVS
jgi:hypothetical protein